MAEDRKWPWADSPFISPAEDSDENGMKQILFHDAGIKAYVDLYPLDIDFPIWYGRFHPLRVAAELEYNIVYGTEATGKSQTAMINARLKNIKGKTGKARDWFNRTNAVYLISNPARVIEIWPRGLAIINSGKKDEIIASLKTISNQIGADANPLMIAIKAEIDAEYAIIKPGRTTQQSTLNKKGLTRTDLGTAINLALEMQLGDLGLEINKWRSDPDRTAKIKSLHNLEEIQNTAQKIFNPTLNAFEVMEVCKRTLVFNSKLRLVANGGDIKAYLSSTLGGVDSTAVLVTNGHTLEFTASLFGITDYGTHCYITVVNLSGVRVSFLLQLY